MKRYLRISERSERAFGFQGIIDSKDSCRQYYPEVYLSSGLVEILSNKPALPRKPVRPVEPVFRLGTGRGVGLVVSFAAFGSFVFECSGSGDIPISAYLWAFLLVVACPVAWIIWSATRDFRSAKSKYDTDLTGYQAAVEYVSEETTRLLSPDCLRAYRKKALADWLQERKSGRGGVPSLNYCNDSDDVRRGVAERDFFQEVKRAFQSPYVVRADLKIPVGACFYFPDIAIVGEGLFIDIEVDEPYSDDDGTPIHYVENGISVDNGRNRFLSRNGWEIIRFSEEQVVKEPQACIRYISYIIDCILTCSCPESGMQSSFLKEKWTRGQSSYMALNQMRKTYLAPLPESVSEA